MALTAKGKVSKAIIWVILSLIIVGLVGFGATNFNGSLRSIGKVGDTEIDVNQYSRQIQQELSAYSAQLGQNLTLSQAQSFGLDQAVLQRLISTAALTNETKTIGLSVGDEEVQRQVLSTQAFRGLDGNFDREAYEFQLRNIGMTPAEFEQSVRNDSASAILQQAVSSGFTTPETYSDTLMNFLRERRNFSWIELDATWLDTPMPAATDAEIQAYYDEHTDDFMLPETRKLTYAWVTPDTMVDTAPVDEADIQRLYEDRADEYNRPERRLVERLVFGNETQAEEAAQAITSGTSTFESVVADRGLSLGDIDLGDVDQDELGAAGAEVFALTEPGIVGPVDTDLGPALFRVNAILAAQVTPLEDVREDLRVELARDSARRMIADEISDYDDLLAGGADLEELANETDLELGEIDWTPGMSDGIAGYQAFGAAAASVTQDDYPEIVPLDDGGVFALRLDEIIPARPEPLETAKDRVREAVERVALKAKLTEDAEALKAKVDAGATISSLGYPVTVDTHITREAFVEGTPPDFLTQIFAAEKGESLIVQSDASVLLAYVADILPPDAEDPDTERLKQLITDNADQTLGQDALVAFTRAVENQAGISINQAAVNAVHAQFP